MVPQLKERVMKEVKIPIRVDKKGTKLLIKLLDPSMTDAVLDKMTSAELYDTYLKSRK
jgi:hypothetical protein